MHVRGDLNCTRGYEWAVLAAAKKRNPAIRTYGLTWGVPGWIGDNNDTRSPGNFYSQDNIDYHLAWLDCALNTWGIEIDYLGGWNERGMDPDWMVQLRAALDAAGYLQTRLVSADSGWEPVTSDLAANAAYAAAVDVIGAHYPSQPPAAAYALNKTLFASEMWNLGQVDDWPGAQVLMSDLTEQAQWGLSASILWCLVFSWYAPLPFSRVLPGTNSGAGHSILTAAEPWSGYYELNPTIHAMAHHTQFAAPGWLHLARGSSGMGALAGGGGLVTRFNPRAPAGVLEFSVTAHTAGAAGAQAVALALAGLPPGAPPPPALHAWFTNATSAFVRLPDVPYDAAAGAYALTLAPNAFYSFTTTTGQGAPAPRAPARPSAPFPFPYADAFDGYAEGAIARYFCDEGGAFVAAAVPPAFGRAGGALKQIVTKVPIVWEKNPDPYTLIGNFNAGGGAWADYVARADVAIDPSAMPPPSPGPPGDIEAGVMQACAGGGSAGGAGAQAFALDARARLQSLAAPALCLGATGATLFPGALDMGLVPCGGAPAWAYSGAAAGAQLRMAGGLCLDVDGGNASAGARALAYACKAPASGGAANQQWDLVPLAGGAAGAVALRSRLASPGLCLGVQALPGPPPPPLPYVMLAMRIAVYQRNGPPPSGYTLRVTASANASAPGAWALQFAGAVLASGATPAPVLPGVFYAAEVGAAGGVVTARWAGAQLAQVNDAKGLSGHGMAALGSGWHEAWFDNFSVSLA